MRGVNEKHEPATENTGGEKVRGGKGRWKTGEEQCAAFTRNLSQFNCGRHRRPGFALALAFSSFLPHADTASRIMIAR